MTPKLIVTIDAGGERYEDQYPMEVVFTRDLITPGWIQIEGKNGAFHATYNPTFIVSITLEDRNDE